VKLIRQASSRTRNQQSLSATPRRVPAESERRRLRAALRWQIIVIRLIRGVILARTLPAPHLLAFRSAHRALPRASRTKPKPRQDEKPGDQETRNKQYCSPQFAHHVDTL
jgi:hypothetical protein